MSTRPILPRATSPRPSGRGRCAATAFVLLAAAAPMSAAPAGAQDRPASRPPLDLSPAGVRARRSTQPGRLAHTIGGDAPPGPCVQVDIAGHRAGHLDCASQALQAAGRIAQAQARSAIDTPVLEAGSPDVRVGVSSLSGSRLRMGNALGSSVHPQRPNRPPSAPRPGGQP